MPLLQQQLCQNSKIIIFRNVSCKTRVSGSDTLLIILLMRHSFEVLRLNFKMHMMKKMRKKCGSKECDNGGNDYIGTPFTLSNFFAGLGNNIAWLKNLMAVGTKAVLLFLLCETTAKTVYETLLWSYIKLCQHGFRLNNSRFYFGSL